MARLTKEQTRKLKEHAKSLYLDHKLSITNNEIATRVGITPKTLANWIEKEGWEKLKTGLATSKSQALIDFYAELDALNTIIKNREEGKQFADFKESQQRRQLIKDIKDFETETSIAQIYEVGTKLLDFIKPQNEEFFKQLLPFYDAFLRENLK